MHTGRAVLCHAVLQALAADVRLACDVWRDAFNTCDMSHDDAFKGGDARLADAVEDTLQQLMEQAAAGSNLAAAAGIADEQQQQQQQQEEGLDAKAAAAAVKAEGAAADAMDVDPQEHHQQQQDTAEAAAAAGAGGGGGEGAAAAAAVVKQEAADGSSPDGVQGTSDPHSLSDPRRPFNALSGCRMCWSEGDKARLLLCDGCEEEYHCYCVTPALLEVPEGDWYCRLCRKQGGTEHNNSQHGGGDSSSKQLPSAPVGAVAGSGSTAGVSWDMAAAAALPETCTAATTNTSSGMEYIRSLVGAAQRLSQVPYGSWPAEARLQLLLLLCELLSSSNAGRRFLEERMEGKREAKKKVAEARARINKAKREAAEAAKAAAKEAKAAKKAAAGGTGTAAAGGSGRAGGSGAPASVEDGAAGRVWGDSWG